MNTKRRGTIANFGLGLAAAAACLAGCGDGPPATVADSNPPPAAAAAAVPVAHSTVEEADDHWLQTRRDAEERVADSVGAADGGVPGNPLAAFYGDPTTVEWEFPAGEPTDPRKQRQAYRDFVRNVIESELKAEYGGDVPESAREAADRMRTCVLDESASADAAEVDPVESAAPRLKPLAAALFCGSDLSDRRRSEVFAEADAAAREAGVHPFLRFVAARMLIYRQSGRYRPDAARLAEAFCDCVGHREGGPEDLYAVEQLVRACETLSAAEREPVAGRISDRTRAEGLPPLGALRVLGRLHRRRLLDARGPALASAVPDRAWPVVEREGALAAGYYQAAFLADPRDDGVIVDILNLTHYVDAGPSPRQWLMESVRRHRSATAVFGPFASQLRPKWGGSLRQLTSLADALADVGEFESGGLSWAAVDVLGYADRAAEETRRFGHEDGDAGELIRQSRRRATQAVLRMADGIREVSPEDLRPHAGGVKDVLMRLDEAAEEAALLSLFRHGAAAVVDEAWRTRAEEAVKSADALGEANHLALVKAIRASDADSGEAATDRLRSVLERVRSKAGAGDAAAVRAAAKRLADVERFDGGGWLDVPFGRPGGVTVWKADRAEVSDDGTAVTLFAGDYGPYFELPLPGDGPVEVELEVEPRVHPRAFTPAPYGVVVGSQTDGLMFWASKLPGQPDSGGAFGVQRLPFTGGVRRNSWMKPGPGFVKLRMAVRESPKFFFGPDDERLPAEGVGLRGLRPVTVGGIPAWDAPQCVAIRNLRFRRLDE